MDKIDKAVNQLLGEAISQIKSAEDIKAYEDKFKKTAQISGKIADALDGEDAWNIRDGVYNTNPLGYGDIIDFNKEELRDYEDDVIGGFDSEDAQESFEAIVNASETGAEAGIVVFKNEDIWVELDLEPALEGKIDGLVVTDKKGEIPVSSVEEIVSAVKEHMDAISEE